jgi:hypothetical protein
MKSLLPLFVFVDACGWEIIKNDAFVRDLAPNRRRLTSVLGYSSACVPSILSGRWPAEHRNWSYFVYNPKGSPFRHLRALRWLPSRITSRRIFRRWLSRLIKTRLGFRGYFDLYNIPFRYIDLFDFTEKNSPLQPKGLNRGPNLFDHLEARRIRYHVSSPQQAEEANLSALLSDVGSENIDFAFLYWPDLDGLLHSVGNDSPEVTLKLRQYELMIERLWLAARRHYYEVRLYVFSDHGMANCDEHIDLRKAIQSLPVRMPEDYVAVYDSTMARFWFLNERARQDITNYLQGVSQGRILPEAELKRLKTFFPDHYFGELIFLVKEGVLIVPSDMGARPIRAMHGYHPNEIHSFAALCTNQEDVPDDIRAIPDMYRLMVRDAELAQVRNRNTVTVGIREEADLPAEAACSQ